MGTKLSTKKLEKPILFIKSIYRKIIYIYIFSYLYSIKILGLCEGILELQDHRDITYYNL